MVRYISMTTEILVRQRSAWQSLVIESCIGLKSSDITTYFG